MSNSSDFIIEDGVLKKYQGPGGDVVVPDEVTSIGSFDRFSNGAFYHCENLTSIVLPQGLTSVGRQAFCGCRNLTSIMLPENVTSLGDESFYGCRSLASITLPDGLTSIGNSAFSDCGSLTNITIPESVTKIGWSAFWGCESLTSVTIPKNVISIGSGAFCGCNSLIEVTSHPDNSAYCVIDGILYSKDKKKLVFCPGGKTGEIVIPAGVTSIDDNAFYRCWGLTSIVLPEGVTSIGNNAFNWCKNLKSIKLNAGLTSIGRDAFNSCNKLERIVLPDGLISIGSSAFWGCNYMTQITIPDSVTSIGSNAFSFCNTLTSIHLPRSLTSIANKLFHGCDSLKEVLIPPEVADVIAKMSNSEFKELVLDSGLWKWLDAENKARNFLKRQSKTLTSSYVNNTSEENLGPMCEAFVKMLEGKISAKECNVIADFMTLFSLKTPAANLQNLYQALRAHKNGEKAVSTIESDPELKAIVQNITAQSDEPVAADPYSALMHAHQITGKDAELKLNDFYSLSLADLPALTAKDGTTVPPAFLAWLLTAHEEKRKVNEWSSGKPEPRAGYLQPGIRPEIMPAVSLLDEKSFQAALLKLADQHLAKYVSTNKKYLTFPICRYADETTMAELVRRAPSWKTGSSGYLAPPVWQFREALLYSNTRSAMMFADKVGDLRKYAYVRNISEDAVRDKYLADVGLDPKGGKTYDLGNQTVTARLQKDLGFLIELPDGKTVKSLPKKGADSAKYELANADFSEMKKSVKQILKNRRKVLFADYLSGRTRPIADWKTSYLENPLLHEAASLLVWAQGKNTFTLSDSGPIDSYGKAYTFSDVAVKVAHPMEMEPAEVTAWQKYYAAHGLKQPFAQIWEPVIDPDLVKEDRYAGCLIPYYRFLGQEKHGITVEDEDFHNLISINFVGCQAEVERIDWERHNISPQHRFEIKQFKFDKFSRQVNHIVTYLDQVIIWDRVRKDDVSAIDVIDRFTLAQIVELIKTAQEAKAVNVLALLLEYKNTHFAEFDPMEEFSLEW